ncbi:MAG: hypothetical protein ACTSXZ_07860 [Alphaproteobacteria bacterium]
MVRKRITFFTGLLIICLLMPALASALEPVEVGPLYWRMSGYVKSFTSMMQGGDIYREFDLTSRETFWDNATRARLRSRMYFGDVMDVVVHYELSNQFGDTPRLRTEAEERYGASPFGEEILGSLFPQVGTPQYFDLDHQIDRGDDYVLSHRLDRLFARFHTGPWDFTIGRSTLTWGPGRFWNPTDYVAVFSPTEIDKEEKIGIDLAHARVAITDEIALEGFAAPVRQGRHDIDTHGSAAAGRLVVRALEADWALSGGWLYDRTKIGFDVDAIVGDAGVRGAITRTVVEGVPNEAFYSAVVNADYAFAWKWDPIIMGEYHYNGFGEADPDDYLELAERPEFAGAYARGEVANYGVHYLGATLTLKPHPLVALSESAIVNLTDQSAFNFFVLTWSALQSLDVQLGAQNTFGPVPSEYGGLESPLSGNKIMVPDLYYTDLKYYF